MNIILEHPYFPLKALQPSLLSRCCHSYQSQAFLSSFFCDAVSFFGVSFGVLVPGDWWDLICLGGWMFCIYRSKRECCRYLGQVSSLSCHDGWDLYVCRNPFRIRFYESYAAMWYLNSEGKPHSMDCHYPHSFWSPLFSDSSCTSSPKSSYSLSYNSQVQEAPFLSSKT